MDIKLHKCEQCENIITIDSNKIPETNKNGVFDCPLCGTLNVCNTHNKGSLVITSHLMECEDDFSSDKVIIEELPVHIDSALRTLMSYGWKIKFILDD